LVLIASENFAHPAVLEAMASVLTNKYAEGYPGRRYYGGCEFADQVESLALERAKALFGAEHANVQPHAGSQANMAVYFAALKPGDTILGMDLAHGGHLTHGSPVNFSGILYRMVFYGVRREDERIDYDQVVRLAEQHKPKMIIAGATAYPRVIDFARFREAADLCGGCLCADIAHPAGLIAAGLHPSPVPVAEFVSSTTHKTLRGPRSGLVLCRSEWAQALDRAVFPGIQGGPLMHVIAAKAVCFKQAMAPSFVEYQRRVIANARALGKALQEGGLALVAGGTDNHLLLVKVRPLGITGAQAETVLDSVGITVNKNMIPFDTQKPRVTSGIRLGTAALTTRGMREAEMEMIGGWIVEALKGREDSRTTAAIAEKVRGLTSAFPAYAEEWL